MAIQPVAVSHTFAFLQKCIRRPPARVLDVGCGGGDLAKRLIKDGYTVVAIDSNPDAVEHAKEAGIDARHATWPDFHDEPFDAIVFCRSLHHISPLSDSIAHAGRLLRDSGRIVVEDFAYGEMDRESVEWLKTFLAYLHGSNQIKDEQSFATHLLSSSDAYEAWMDYHDHHLHSAKTMDAELRRSFPKVSSMNAPCFYRYIAQALIDVNNLEFNADWIKQVEQHAITSGRIRALGRRWVGHLEEAVHRLG